MEDTFIVFWKGKVLIVLRNLPTLPHPSPAQVLDWFAENYAFYREDLSGCWSQSIDCKDEKYQDIVSINKLVSERMIAP